MDGRQLYHTMAKFSPISDEAWNDFEQLLESASIERGEYLIKAGDRAQHCYLLLDGVVRVYFDKEGNEYNKTFFVPGMFPTPITALITNSPSELSFQALLPCSLVRFSYLKFRELFDPHPCLERLMLRILEVQWIKKEKHDIRMVTNDATTNYMIFRETYPGLEKLIPQYHIASYLGITPIQLSRIRAQLARSSS